MHDSIGTYGGVTTVYMRSSVIVSVYNRYPLADLEIVGLLGPYHDSYHKPIGTPTYDALAMRSRPCPLASGRRCSLTTSFHTPSINETRSFL